MKISTRFWVLTRKLVNYHLGRRTSCCQPGLFEDSADMPPINRTIDHLTSSWVSYRPLDVLITFLQFEGCAGLNWVMLPGAKISNKLMIEAKITSMLTLMFGSITATRVRVIFLDFKRASRLKKQGLGGKSSWKKLSFVRRQVHFFVACDRKLVSTPFKNHFSRGCCRCRCCCCCCCCRCCCYSCWCCWLLSISAEKFLYLLFPFNPAWSWHLSFSLSHTHPHTRTHTHILSCVIWPVDSVPLTFIFAVHMQKEWLWNGVEHSW